MKDVTVEVINEDLKDHPHCPHGPTILFSRRIKGSQNRFYACAAYRDRKYCNFFLLEDEKDKFKKNIWKEETKKCISNVNHRKKFLMLNKMYLIHPERRQYCTPCSELILENVGKKHENHQILTPISDYQLKHPSELLLPLSNSKKEAQYFFSKLSVEVILECFKTLGFKDVICVGTPRIHEYIQNHCENMTSLLLDIDKRFHDFFGPLQYCWYNFFNHHFFFSEAKQTFKDYLKYSKNTVLITDPPFGGRLEPIAFTLDKINEEYKILNNANHDLPMFLILPYFMEPQILNWLPKFKMLDYKVDYENHSLLQHNVKRRKQGSPVRIFTNISPSLIKLPYDGYKYCELCDKWVTTENKHCSYCNSCTSKNGTTYKHCLKCQKCVKPSWQHCKTCDRCSLVDHKCETIIFSKNCFHCKLPGHKRSECPKNVLGSIIKRKKKKKKLSK